MLLLAYSSNGVRDHLVIPAVADSEHCPTYSGGGALLSDEAAFYGLQVPYATHAGYALLLLHVCSILPFTCRVLHPLHDIRPVRVSVFHPAVT